MCEKMHDAGAASDYAGKILRNYQIRSCNRRIAIIYLLFITSHCNRWSFYTMIFFSTIVNFSFPIQSKSTGCKYFGYVARGFSGQARSRVSASRSHFACLDEIYLAFYFLFTSRDARVEFILFCALPLESEGREVAVWRNLRSTNFNIRVLTL